MMSLKFAGALALFAALALPQTADAAVFAGQLKMVKNLDNTFNLSYRLNEDANDGVTVRIKGPSPSSAVIRSLTFASQSKGLQSVVWDGNTDLSVAAPSGTYTWEVEARANNTGSTPYVMTGTGSERQTQFFSPDVAAFKNPAHPLFGTVVVTNSGGATPAAINTVTGRPTPDGVYLLGNDLADYTSQGDTPYTGGIVWNASSNSSPYRSFVSSDAKAFISDLSDAHSGLWIMDLETPTATFSSLFNDDATRLPTGLTSGSMHGNISTVHVEGSGANRVLYTFDEDLEVYPTPRNGSIWKYPIGTTLTDYSSSRTVDYDDSANGDKIINFTGEIVRDPKNPAGWWITQNRATESATNPSLIHYNGTAVDFNSFSSTLPAGTTNAINGGALDVSADGNLVVISSAAAVKVLDVTNLAAPTLLYTGAASGNTKRGLAFDAAGNILVASPSAENVRYFSKQGTNTFVTPASASNVLAVGGSSVSGWELY